MVAFLELHLGGLLVGDKFDYGEGYRLALEHKEIRKTTGGQAGFTKMVTKAWEKAYGVAWLEELKKKEAGREEAGASA